MKTLTIWQPWASLLACGAKKYETRSWATKYRGPIAIHAANKPYSLDDIDFGLIRGFADAVEGVFGKTFAHSLPFGDIIATAELVGCHRMVRHGGRGLSSAGSGWLETDNGIYKPTDNELLFGDWTPGRYAWEFANMTMLQVPIPAKGRQRLWEWEESHT